jgi:hypothetical protein
MLDDFWKDAVIIDAYTDTEAIEDGYLIDVSNLGITFNGKLINRVTVGVSSLLGFAEMDSAIKKNRLRFIAGNSVKDREGEDAWGIFAANPLLGNEKLWLVGNELGGYSVILPSEY